MGNVLIILPNSLSPSLSLFLASYTPAHHNLLSLLFFFLVNDFILFFLAALGLRCCAQALCSCGEWGLLFVAVRGLLTAVASLVAEHGL